MAALSNSICWLAATAAVAGIANANYRYRDRVQSCELAEAVKVDRRLAYLLFGNQSRELF